VILTDAIRIDRGSTLQSPRRTEHGFLRCSGHAARVGILEYSDSNYPGGVRRELRLPEDVFEDESLASYEAAPYTAEHPPVMLDKHNASQFQHGTVLTPGRADGDHVAIDVIITEPATIAAVESGELVELSSGYRIKLDMTPGEHPRYGSYHCRQRHIRVNHVAGTRRGRSGPTVRLRTDGADGTDLDVLVEREPADEPSDPVNALSSDGKSLSSGRVLDSPQAPPRTDGLAPNATPHKDPMADTNQTNDLAAQLTKALEQAAQEKVRADAAEKKLAEAEGSINVLTAQANKLNAERADAAAKDTQIAELTSRVDSATKELEATKARLDAAEKIAAAVPEQIKAGVKSRLDIERAAGPILAAADGQPARLDDKSDRQVMELVITKRGGTVESDRNDDFVRGAFNAAVKSWQDGEAALAATRGSIRQPTGGNGNGGTGGSTRADGLEGRTLMVARNRGLVTD
jgi:hypothetical protein